MKAREILNLGFPPGRPVQVALRLAGAARKAKVDAQTVRQRLREILADPSSFAEDPRWSELATALRERASVGGGFVPRAQPAPHRQWGTDLEPSAVQQLLNACQLPITARGALMPDAHPGYGLPIGGVLATRNAVIPYAVGVDIACRMKMTVLDIPVTMLAGETDRLRQAIERQTRFGIGATFRDRRDHPVMDEDWEALPLTRQLKDKAWAQLGTSGSGNHFVEFGTFQTEDRSLGVEPGVHLALLSHSGSRGAGATIAGHYSRLAMSLHPELPPALLHLAWLDLETAEGQEYWAAMELMGRYASANHACIHRSIARHLGAGVLLDLENHHNFAWREEHGGESFIVHRKGATPAGAGVVGIIPGSMASTTYVVRGKGEPDSLRSAAHGAGRIMSRAQARRTFTWHQARKVLEARGVTLMSAGLDEVPMVYKDIDQVMAAQSDLVERIARFQPRLVKMAPPGERPED